MATDYICQRCLVPVRGEDRGTHASECWPPVKPSCERCLELQGEICRLEAEAGHSLRDPERVDLTEVQVFGQFGMTITKNAAGRFRLWLDDGRVVDGLTLSDIASLANVMGQFVQDQIKLNLEQEVGP